MSLANYAAGAIIMPYASFLAAAERQRYDVDRLCADFGSQRREVSHRPTPSPAPVLADSLLHDEGRRGGERIEALAARAPFSRFGGTCRAGISTPPSRLRAGSPQIVEAPDGMRFFSTSRTVDRAVRLDPRESSQLAIGLGCDVRYAPKILYADGQDPAKPYVTPIGPACTVCPRLRCPQRAAAPAGRTLALVETQKTISPYPFVG